MHTRKADRFYISYGKYRQLATRWGGKEAFKDMKGRGHGSDFIKKGKRGYTGDGNQYTAVWDNKWETSEPLVTVHRYENRVAASSSVLNFREVTELEKQTYGVFDYPHAYEGSGALKMLTILPENASYQKAEKYFEYLNGRYGPDRFMRLWVLIFEDQDREAAFVQQQYWKNGNKNEFTLCIGTDKTGRVLWGEVFSWTECDEIVVRTRNRIEEMKKVDDASLVELAKWAEKNICTQYVKPEFTEKYAHLSVDPPLWVIIVVWSIIVLATVGMCIFIVVNDLEEGENLKNFRDNNRRRYRRW